MAMNFDAGKARSVIRGEVNGSVRFLVLFFGACAVWLAANQLSGMARSASSALALQQSRYRSLIQLTADYKARSVPEAAHADVMAVFMQISSQVGLGTRVTRLTPAPDGKKCSVEAGRLYAEDVTRVIRELAARGVRISSAEFRALPVGEERLFSLTAVLETES